MRKNKTIPMNIFEEKELLDKISTRIKLVNKEDEAVISTLLPVWHAIILGGLLKLVKNRIRYNALINFLKDKVPSSALSLLNDDLVGHDQQIQSYGESLIGILFPDKKSALAIHVSQKFHCKSSFVLKGLSYVLGMVALELKKQEQDIEEFNAYCDFILSYKSDFNEIISNDLQKAFIDILLLSDVIKADGLSIFPDSFEEADDEESFVAKLFTKRNSIILLSLILLIGVTLFFRFIQKENTVSVDETEDIIPLDSLNKLNDSLIQAVVDSTKLASDSTLSLSWTEGKVFTLPKQSAIVLLHQYLTDSTATTPLDLPCFEITFQTESDQIGQVKEYFFRRFVEGFQAYPNSKIEIVAFSEKDSKSALKRGFMLKNRLVGEGLSPKRISILPANNDFKPDTSIPLNAQVIFRITQ